ncbi:NADP-dependent 3-hydroxy acid dehydrogenase YdfG [Motilibacter rhizosphaerae]|uniref:NADP-dependent 3-hydroxy acid dehydrogenase YdfG n=1 Tax=Motilibacter rhizosphaerae TaxID=598652 RepID=A0A4Q7NXB2_9ACTN|nr:SDR family NAD(P)-dependent oxidoreductase [Motilibacter rhizosphaerae]RZS91630.1 NADP-dependent 3-hydroxy acid dehydrogenase YdfG [Motilibacter rhizosphaerae]
MADPRVLWVTGAGSGMGRASAVAVAAGRRVALSGRRRDRLEEVAALVEQTGGEALVLPLDARDPAALADAHDEIRSRWGAVGDVVLSAGLNAPRRTWADQSMTDVQAVLDTNFSAVVRAVDAVLPDLRTSHGQVVVVSSYAAWRFSPGAGVAYSASKTALSAVCQTLNAQEAAHGVRATHLCPGDVDTEFLRLRPAEPGAEARARMLSPDDVARAVRFVLESPAHVRIDELVISPVSQA